LVAEPLAGGPSELVLMASIARRYYVEGQSKVQIADSTNLSRFKIARLLDKAVAAGLVRIEISYPGAIDIDLSSRLQDALGLRRALVLDVPEDEPAALRRQLGKAAADLIAEITTPQDVLGLAWGRSLSAMGATMTRLPACTVVQMTGALPGPTVDASSTELVREAARIGGGAAYYFHAPMIVSSPQTARSLRDQPEVARAFRQFRSITKALVGIGSWEPPFSTVYDALDPKERRALHRLGVRAEVSGILIDFDGKPVASPLAERTIGIDAAQLTRVPEVLAIAYGRSKDRAVLAALRGGLVNGLVTHGSLATALIAAATAGGQPGGR
jgi:DNA-binding transcriptional regulator LsrR (DeoR family)